MDDLISRQEAVDAVQRHREGVLGSYEYDEGVAFVYAAAHNHIIDVIKHLPSAQPTQTNALNALGTLDCISRKAAINAMCDNCDHVQAVCPHYPCKAYNAVEQLPTTQPEIAKDINVPSNDCISRQAAIDVLARTAREKFNLSDEFNYYLAGLMDGETAIRQLPTAQPELVRCRDCRWSPWRSRMYADSAVEIKVCSHSRSPEGFCTWGERTATYKEGQDGNDTDID